MTAMQIERDGQRVWVNLTAQEWPPSSLPLLVEHMTSASLGREGYNGSAFSQQFMALLRGWTADEVVKGLEALFAQANWWRASYALWVLTQLRQHPQTQAAVRARLSVLPMGGEEALALGRWMVQSSFVIAQDEVWLRALRRAGNLEALRCTLQGLARLGLLWAEDIDAGRQALLADPPPDPSFYTLAAIMRVLGDAEALRDDDYTALLSRAQDQRFYAIVSTIQAIGHKARGAVDLLVRLFLEGLEGDPPQFSHNIMQALVHADGGEKALGCLEALAKYPHLFEGSVHSVCAWLRRLDAPSRRAQVLALLERFRTGAVVGNFYVMEAAFEVEHPQAVAWFIEGLGSAQASFMRSWLDMVQEQPLTEAQRQAIARVLLGDPPAPRSWRCAGALILLGVQRIDADVRALLMGRWSQAHAESQDPSGRRLPRAPGKKRLTHEALTIAVAVHESLQDPARAESAARALARWSQIGPQSGFKPLAFYKTLDWALAGIARALPQTLPERAFDALSRALCALVGSLSSPPKDANPHTHTACQNAHGAAQRALLALYTEPLKRLRDTHPAVDRLCHLTETQDPDAPSELAAALSRYALPAALAGALLAHTPPRKGP